MDAIGTFDDQLEPNTKRAVLYLRISTDTVLSQIAAKVGDGK